MNKSDFSGKLDRKNELDYIVVFRSIPKLNLVNAK